MKGPGNVSHREALEHARKEYEVFKERLFIAPTDNVKQCLVHFNDLLMIEKKNKNKK